MTHHRSQLSDRATSRTGYLHALGALVLLSGAASASPQAALGHELAFEGWAEEVRPLVAGTGSLAPFARDVAHDVLGVRMEYTTTYRGKPITVSGLVVFPIDTDAEAPILVWNHGTIFDEQSAPSHWSDAVRLQLIPALSGMIVFMPDYVGYGASAEQIHPYILRADLVPSVIDMVHAGRRLLEDEGVPFSQELHLFGFSEGGYVTLATAHEIDTNDACTLEVAEVHAVSGPYDMLEASSLILSDESYPIPAYVAFLYGAYNDRYWKRPMEDFFVEPHASLVTRFQARETGLGTLARSMPPTLGDLLSPAFTDRYEADREPEIKATLAENCVPAWSPLTPTFIYHGTADRDVPFPIGKKQYEAMLAEGADPAHLSFIPYEGADHSATVFKALRAFLDRR